jgi:hypothetical protein
VGFLRRILGGGEAADAPDATDEPLSNADQAELDAEERARDLELLREEQERMSDLTRRQLRYADHAWRPPDQGGERRSGDEHDPSDVA